MLRYRWRYLMKSQARERGWISRTKRSSINQRQSAFCHFHYHGLYFRPHPPSPSLFRRKLFNLSDICAFSATIRHPPPARLSFVTLFPFLFLEIHPTKLNYRNWILPFLWFRLLRTSIEEIIVDSKDQVNEDLYNNKLH